LNGKNRESTKRVGSDPISGRAIEKPPIESYKRGKKKNIKDTTMTQQGELYIEQGGGVKPSKCKKANVSEKEGSNGTWGQTSEPRRRHAVEGMEGSVREGRKRNRTLTLR